MATGRLPFTGASPSETVTNILENVQVPLTTLSSDRPKELERIVDKLLAKQPERRYESANELQHDLSAFKNRPQSTLLGRLLGRHRKK